MDFIVLYNLSLLVKDTIEQLTSNWLQNLSLKSRHFSIIRLTLIDSEAEVREVPGRETGLFERYRRYYFPN